MPGGPEATKGWLKSSHFHFLSSKRCSSICPDLVWQKTLFAVSCIWHATFPPLSVTSPHKEQRLTRPLVTTAIFHVVAQEGHDHLHPGARKMKCEDRSQFTPDHHISLGHTTKLEAQTPASDFYPQSLKGLFFLHLETVSDVTCIMYMLNGCYHKEYSNMIDLNLEEFMHFIPLYAVSLVCFFDSIFHQ